MSQVPSDIAASAAQAGFQARQLLDQRDARRAGQVHAAARQVKTVDEAGNTVETTDNDNQVFTNAEGQGSQGRAFEEDPPTAPAAASPPDPRGVRTDPDGSLHVDIEA